MKSTILLCALFGSALAVSAVPVTFKVDMSVKAAESTFLPATDTVDVRGPFNSWGPGSDLTDPDGDKIYEGTVEVPDESIGQNIEYKFVYVHEGTDNWESIANRTFTLDSVAQVLPETFYNNDATISISIKAEINFELDMAVQTATGKFDPATDEVYVRGNKAGWGAPPEGLKLTESTNRPGVYTGTYRTDSILTGETFEYKYTIWKPETSFTGWEEGGNKTIVFDGTEPDANTNGYLEKTLSLAYFNNVTLNDVILTDTEVTFQVNMATATRQDGTPFDPTAEGVWVNGNFANWYGWGTLPTDYQLFDDATHGDTTAGDHVYTLRVSLPKGTVRMLDYKYAIESQDNEAGFANNHVRYINGEGTFTLPVDTFGTMTRETAPGLGTLQISKVNPTTLRLSWTAASGVTLEQTPSLTNPTWTAVTTPAGASSIEIPTNGTTAFFRLVRP